MDHCQFVIDHDRKKALPNFYGRGYKTLVNNLLHHETVNYMV